MSQKVKNNCRGKRGCRVAYILPTCIRSEQVHKRLFRQRYDTKKVLFKARLLLDKVA